jgi:hypothetical protein
VKKSWRPDGYRVPSGCDSIFLINLVERRAIDQFSYDFARDSPSWALLTFKLGGFTSTMAEARRIAANIAKLPELLKPQ